MLNKGLRERVLLRFFSRLSSDRAGSAPSPPWRPGTGHSTDTSRRHSSHHTSHPEGGGLCHRAVPHKRPYLDVVLVPGRPPEEEGRDAGEEAGQEGAAEGGAVEAVGVLTDHAWSAPCSLTA